jgi:gluconate 2-dehydrogenase gamma chain
MSASLSGFTMDNTHEQQPTEEPWKTLFDVQNHLFPTDKDSPGAKDIHATRFLKNIFSDPYINKEDITFIGQGVGWLNELTQETYKKSFSHLSHEARETILKKIAQSRAGENWLSLLINYIIEALLSDPVYGGNVNKAGWQWLEHQAGYPRPPIDKRFTQYAL